MTAHPIRFTLLVSLLLPLLAGLSAHAAQAPADTISGVVLDPNHHALPRATVRLLDAADRDLARTLTDSEGRFRFAGLPPGRYTLTAELVGFQTSSQSAEAGAVVELVLPVAPVRETVVVTATRTEAPSSQVGSSVTVLPAELLRNRHSATLTELLRAVPGMTPLQSGSPGALTSLFARGGESDHNRVLIDGVPVNEPGGAFNFANLTPLNLTRIEVVRGPHSALFGSDALGSVVQLFTERGAAETPRPRFRFTAEGGQHDTFRGAAGLSGEIGWFDYSVAAGRFLTDNELPNSAFRNTTLSGNFGAALGKRASLRLIVRGDFGTVGTPGPTAFLPPDPDFSFRRRDGVVNLSLRHETTSRWQQQVSAAYSRSRQRSLDPTSFFPEFLNDSRRYRLLYQSDYAFSPSHSVTFAFEWERQLARVDSLLFLLRPVPSADRTNLGYVAQYQGLFFGRLSLTGGFRVEDNQGFGTEFIPRLSVAYFLRRQGNRLGSTKLKFNFGLGVKEPQVFETLTVEQATLLDPTLPARLHSERVRSFDVGLEQRFWQDRAKLEVNWFDNRFRDLIVFKPLSLFTFTFDNVDRTKAKGAEVALELAPGANLRALAGYTYLNSQVVKSTELLCNEFNPTVPAQGQPLCRRPRHSGSFLLFWDWRWLNLTSSTVFVGRRADSDFTGRGLTRSPGFTKWDLAASLHPRVLGGQRLTYYGVAENLLNRRYMEVLGFPALKMTVRAGARVEF